MLGLLENKGEINMPYITQSDRQKFSAILKEIHNLPEISTKGELEFLIFTLMRKFIQTKPSKYSILHDMVYAATHCADEARRRYLDVRENLAREQNGDIEI